MNPCNVLLVSPKFPASTFWNIKATCGVNGARHSSIPLGLLTVAALLPVEWTCRLIDRNVSELTQADLVWADLVMTGGMNVQRPDCLSVIALAQGCGKSVVVGGPDATSEPSFYAHADFLVLGAVEVIIQDLIDAWNSGRRAGTFRAEKFKVDVTRTPIPRYDLIRRSDYLYYAVQFSRGCPFTCEFCDIIELYGRNPRVKTPVQVLHELEALHAAGYRGHVDFVDDNFIGNKKAVKAFLPQLIAWQRQHHYPFIFSTEASINLADDDELLALMREAGFFVVFIGIESPDGDTLVAMRKKQNTRRHLAESIRKIYAAGMFVMAGFIVGFDSEKGSIADDMVEAIEEAAIPVCMVGLLTVLANTQLAARLGREHRVYPVGWQERLFAEGGGDQCTLGLNFATRRPRREVLADYRDVIERIYAPSAYFGRVARVARVLNCISLGRTRDLQQGKAPLRILGLARDDWASLWRLLQSVIRNQPIVLGHTLLALGRCARENPGALHAVGIMIAFYLHLGPFSRVVSAAMTRQIQEIDRGHWQNPLLEEQTGTEADGHLQHSAPLP